MSTKTTFKRIALVAVASLGFGLLSAAPSSAATPTQVYSYTVSNTITASTTPRAAGTATTVTLVVTTNATTEAAKTITIAPTFKLLDPNGTDVTSTAVCAAVADNSILTSTAVTANTCAFTSVIPGGSAGAASNVGTMTFTPTVGGLYSITVTAPAGVVQTGGIDTMAAVNAGTVLTAATTNFIHVSGINVSQGTTRGVPGAARVGNQGKVFVLLPTSAGTAAQTYRFTSSGVGAIVGATPANLTNTNISGVSTDFGAGVIGARPANTTLTTQELTLTSTAAGIQTITVTTVDTATGLSTALYSTTVTWGSAPALSTAASLARIAPVTTAASAQGALTAGAYSSTLDAGVYGAARGTSAATNQIATIQVVLLNSNGTAALQGNVVTASVAGAGLVLVNNSGAAANGTARSSSYPTTVGSENVAWVHVNTDGTSGVGTITVSVTDAVTGATTVLGTKSVYSWGSVAKLEVSTSNYKIGRAGFTTGAAAADRTVVTSIGGTGAATTVVVQGDGTQTTTPAFIVKATDSVGGLVNIPSEVPAVVSSDLTVASGGTCVLDTAGAASLGDGYGYYNCSFSIVPTATSGSKATLTIRVLDPARAAGTVSYITTTYEVSVGGSPVTGTETLTFDKTSYEPGEAMVVTRSAKDSDGNPVFDGATAPAVTFTKAITGTILASTYVGGTRATSATAPTVFAPAVSGSFSGYMTANNLARVTATATVGDDAATTAAAAAGDAAAEATDAANAATDAANAAAEAADAATAAAQDAADAVAALSTSVTAMVDSLRKQITSLTNLVIKIQRKVRA
jgi:trimeric autotransporter adhesin